MELHKGTSLQKGKYAIEKKLGSGSFGITYLASMKAQVAGSLGAIETTVPVTIKEFFMSELNRRSADGSVVEGTQTTLVTNYRRKFRTEAENLGRMEHPNIVKVLEVWDENNTTYYSMEYIDGVSLDDYIRQYGPLPEAKTIDLFSQLADAVQYMHSKRMLHLDIKPKNAMLNKAGKLLLIDFGLSKQYDANGDPESSTKVGGGTPGYAPVEQADFHDGKDFPVTMDIYALGATLFKMLTGQTPPTASAIVNYGFPLQALEKCNVSQAVIDVVKKTMSPSKRERYQMVTEMINALNGDKRNKEKNNIEREDTIYDSTSSEPQTKTKNSKDEKVAKPTETSTDNKSTGNKKSKSTKKESIFKKHKWLKTVLFIIGGVIVFFLGFRGVQIGICLTNENKYNEYFDYYNYVIAGNRSERDFIGEKTASQRQGEYIDYSYIGCRRLIGEKGKCGLAKGDKRLFRDWGVFETIEPCIHDYIGHDGSFHTPEYSNCDFANQRFLVEDQGKMGFVDGNFNWIVEQNYPVTDADHLYGVVKCEHNDEGVAHVFFASGLQPLKSNDNGKWGYVNRDGNIVVPFQYDDAYPFHFGMARVALKDSEGKLKWGFINSQGEVAGGIVYDEVEDFRYCYSNPYHDGNRELDDFFYSNLLYGEAGYGGRYTVAWKRNDQSTASLLIARYDDFGYPAGNPVYSTQPIRFRDGMGIFTSYNDASIIFAQQDWKGLIDYEGNLVLQTRYDEITFDGKGYAKVTGNGECFKIDKDKNRK